MSYVLYNGVTGKCVDVPGTGKGRIDGPVNQFRCEYSTKKDNQRWYLLYRGTYKGYPVYLIQNAKDKYCLDLPGFGAVKATTPVSEYRCQKPGNPKHDNQAFYRVKTKVPGFYQYINLETKKAGKGSLCLDVAGVNTGGDDAQLTVFGCSKNDDHYWSTRTSSKSSYGCGPAGNVKVNSWSRVVKPYTILGATAIHVDEGSSGTQTVTVERRTTITSKVEVGGSVSAEAEVKLLAKVEVEAHITLAAEGSTTNSVSMTNSFTINPTDNSDWVLYVGSRVVEAKFKMSECRPLFGPGFATYWSRSKSGSVKSFALNTFPSGAINCAVSHRSGSIAAAAEAYCAD